MGVFTRMSPVDVGPGTTRGGIGCTAASDDGTEARCRDRSSTGREREVNERAKPLAERGSPAPARLSGPAWPPPTRTAAPGRRPSRTARARGGARRPRTPSSQRTMSVGERELEHLVEPRLVLGVGDRHEHLDAPVEVARHPVGASRSGTAVGDRARLDAARPVAATRRRGEPHDPRVLEVAAEHASGPGCSRSGPARRGTRQQMPRTIRSICTPAWLAAYSASISCGIGERVAA